MHKIDSRDGLNLTILTHFDQVAISTLQLLLLA